MKKYSPLLAQGPLVSSFLNKGPRPLSSFSFVSIFAWEDFFDFELAMINDRLCIFALGDAGCFLYLPPLGKSIDPATLELVFKHMAQRDSRKGSHRIENIPGNLLSAFGEDRYNHYAKPAEYVYRKEDLMALKGNAYKSQRHDCNLFLKFQRTYSFEAYRDEDLDLCMELYEQWADNRSKANGDVIYLSMLKENRLVHERLLTCWQTLGLLARVLKCEGRIIGYTFGFNVNEKMFCVYAEITDLSVPGSAAYMFKRFCSDEQLKNTSLINTMDDFAMPNVARTKQAYHPIELIPSYSVSIKKEDYQ